MRKSKLLYLVSEDKYFLTHKLPHALIALKNGFEVIIVCKTSSYKKEIENYGFKVKNIQLNRKSLNPLIEIKTIIELFNILKEYKPDIVQNIALKPILYSLICCFFLKYQKEKKINCIVGLGYIFINNKIKTKLLKIILTALLRFFFKKDNNVIVFQNVDDQNLFLKKKIIYKSQSKIISGSGVDEKFYKPANTVKKFDLIMHSRMLRDKGVFELIYATKSLLSQNFKLKILLLGNPDQHNNATIKETDLKLWNQKKIIIWKPEVKNVQKYILQSKVAILPSYREGFPKSLLEAASCGLPLITTDVPGCKEICINRYNGLLVKPKDHEDLAEKIKHLLKNENLISSFGKNSRALVEKKFTTKIISKKFLKLYND